jgi:aspartate-semialdehyde dehydrogenase
MSTPYGNHTIQDLAKFSFSESNVVFFSAGGGRSKEFAPKALHEGAVVIDNSSAFRMDPDVPLVVPEINGETITPNHKLIANPNCSAIIMLMAVAPLRSLGKIRRIIVSTYQSASGAGAAAMEELKEQTGASLRGEPLEPKILPHPYAFNLFSHNTPIDANGYNEEENKVIEESRKILDMPDLLINPTCVRVPVLRAHSESITVEFADHAPSEADVRNVLSHSPGVKVMDDRATNTFPMPLAASGQNDVLVGRIRADISNPNAINLFVAGDQLLKGAALNAVQIAEMMIQKGLISGD